MTVNTKNTQAYSAGSMSVQWRHETCDPRKEEVLGLPSKELSVTQLEVQKGALPEQPKQPEHLEC